MKIRKNISGKELWNLIIQNKITKQETIDFLLYINAEKQYYEKAKVFIIIYKDILFKFTKKEIENSIYFATAATINDLKKAYKIQKEYEKLPNIAKGF